ncbi:MAG: DUF3524 domain-containing protein [Gammaproteobacteria bacterium]|nr:DUF3524 domain-containing protein [Gammaproteobacteria bacterium]
MSAYDAASHKHWRETLVRGLPEFDWTVLTLPARHFYWRMRSNALTFASRFPSELKQEYDLVIATSMVDIGALRGLVPSLGTVPLLLYFHENQFVYPLEKPSSNIVNAQLTSIINVQCADRILFNSVYNRSSFFAGAQALLQRMPDGVEKIDLTHCREQAQILPVPINPVTIARKQNGNHRPDRPVELVWNHRWEYDKQPEVFFGALTRLKATGVDFFVHVMGQSFRQVPECFPLAREELEANIRTWGYVPREQYEAVLLQADFVISTALHDFQGLSLLEAIAAGCLPVVPDRVAYPEYVPEAFRYKVVAPTEATNAQTSFQAVEAESEELCKTLLNLLQTANAVPDVGHYSWTKLEDRYRSLLLDLARR